MSRRGGFVVMKRKRGGRELACFEVRVQVPIEWREKVGKKEALRSTGTGDRREANRKALRIVDDLLCEWSRMAGAGVGMARVSLDPRDVAVQVAYDGMLAALEDRRRDWPKDEEGYSAKIRSSESDLRRLTRRLQDGDLAQWEAIADRSITKRGLSLSRGTPAYIEFVQDLATASIDAQSVFVRGLNGQLNAVPHTDVVQTAKARAAAIAKAGESLLELFEAWAAEALDKGRKRLDTVEQDRKVIQRFSSFVGLDRDVRSIGPIEVADYRDTMRKLPPKWMSKRELRDLDMRAAAAKARELGLSQTAFTNVNKHLSTISPLFTWIARQPKWAGLVNPCNGLFHDGVKGKKRRPSFSTDSLNRILTSPLFTGYRADGEEHLPGSERAYDWRFWVPLVCMFTGARIGEIAQLKVGDVRSEGGAWLIHIRHDQAEGLSTKSSKARIAVVHPTLKQLGFIEFCGRRSDAASGNDAAPLFPELTRNSRGHISGKASRWWRDYLTDIGIKDPDKDGGDGHGSHSFRHTLADRLRVEAELLDNQIAVCLGHASHSTTGGYGGVPQGTVNMLRGWMELVRFDGVSFKHLMGHDLHADPAAVHPQ
jgi:integrase